MRLNADFSERASAHARDMPWVSSPSAGVDRKMFDRVGDEVARATSIVRFARGSAFAPHAHHGGEEFLVLEGTFQDEHGDYPAGTYVRNPIDTAHTPRSDDGCTIFVKLWQFAKDDRAQFHTPFDGLRDTVSPGQTVKNCIRSTKKLLKYIGGRPDKRTANHIREALSCWSSKAKCAKPTKHLILGPGCDCRPERPSIFKWDRKVRSYG